jgi:hypothetical protein
MRRLFQAILLGIIVIIGNSCFKDDEKLAPHLKGTVETDTIPMTINYTYQVYFDLSGRQIVSSNNKTISDLGFDCSPDGWRIILNTAKFMKIADLGAVPFGQPRDTAGVAWKFDQSDGNADSNAVGKWFRVDNSDTLSENHVYLVNRGVDENANSLGFRQLIFDSLSKGKYYFRFADLSGNGVHNSVIAKDKSVNYLFYSLDGPGSVESLEPPKDQYDLLFTQYTTLLFTDEGEPYPYLVTGVLINRDGTEVAIDSIHSFNDVSLGNIQDLHYSSALDVIGYDWKYYSFITGAYSVRTGITYIVHDRDGKYFKLRFIGFYNSAGVKGYPVIEYQLL